MTEPQDPVLIPPSNPPEPDPRPEGDGEPGAPNDVPTTIPPDEDDGGMFGLADVPTLGRTVHNTIQQRRTIE